MDDFESYSHGIQRSTKIKTKQIFPSKILKWFQSKKKRNEFQSKKNLKKKMRDTKKYSVNSL